MGAQKCKHCDLESPRGDFCCLGCEVAFQMIHESGLQDFYRHRSLDLKPVGISSNSEEYLAFDHQEFLDRETQLLDGFRVGTFCLEGLTCAACVWLLERLPQIENKCVESRIHFGQKTIRLKWQDGPQALSSIAIGLSRMGYRLLPRQNRRSEISRISWIRLGITGACAAATMHIGLLFLAAHQSQMSQHDARFLGAISAIVALPAVLFGGFPFFKSSWMALKWRRLHPDQLVSLSILIGFFYSLWMTLNGRIDSYFDSVAMVIFLLLVGRSLIDRISFSISKPQAWTAKKIIFDSVQFVPSFVLRKGDLIRVDPGECVSVDIRLKNYESLTDQSVLTGETEAIRNFEGQLIPQGATNVGASFDGVVEEAQPESKLFLQLNSLEKYTPSSGVADYWQQLFTGCVLLLCLGVLFFEEDSSVSKAMGLLLVTCPCALMLSRPLVLDSARRQAFKRKIILFKTENFLRWAMIKAIAFDKTGTLTTGILAVTKIDRIAQSAEENDLELDEIVFGLCKESQHPLSKALALRFKQKHRILMAISDIKEVPGTGIGGYYNRHHYEIRQNQSLSENPSCSLYRDGHELLRFEFADMLRPHVNEVLSQLKKWGLETILLSGDRKPSVAQFASQISMGQVFSEQRPEDKLRVVSEKPTAFVGDGLNDVLAMRGAFVSLGFTGTPESQFETADGYLIAKDLQLIPDLIRASRTARRVILLNLFISLIYNLVAIVLVMNGSIGPILCAIFMPLSSLTVIAVAYLWPLFRK